MILFFTDYIPDGLSDFANALANPIKYQSELEKRSKQLSILTGELEDPLEVILELVASSFWCPNVSISIFAWQYEVDSKLVNDKEPEEKDMDHKTRAHQQVSLEGGDAPTLNVLESVPNSKFHS